MSRNLLAALNYPNAQDIDISQEIRQIIVWLEVQLIRKAPFSIIEHLDTVGCPEWMNTFEKYKELLGCPRFNNLEEDLHWLLGYAVQLESMKNKEVYLQFSLENIKESIPNLQKYHPYELNFCCKDFKNGIDNIASQLSIEPHANALVTLKAVRKVVTQRMTQLHVENPQQENKNLVLSCLNDLKSGFELADVPLEQAVAILRLLYEENLNKLDNQIEQLMNDLKLASGEKNLKLTEETVEENYDFLSGYLKIRKKSHISRSPEPPMKRKKGRNMEKNQLKEEENLLAGDTLQVIIRNTQREKGFMSKAQSEKLTKAIEQAAAKEIIPPKFEKLSLKSPGVYIAHCVNKKSVEWVKQFARVARTMFKPEMFLKPVYVGYLMIRIYIPHESRHFKEVMKIIQEKNPTLDLNCWKWIGEVHQSVDMKRPGKRMHFNVGLFEFKKLMKMNYTIQFERQTLQVLSNKLNREVIKYF